MTGRRDVEVYGEHPHPQPGESRWESGSGYLIGPRLLLTAAHVVSAHGDARAVVRVRANDDARLYTATVRWHDSSDHVDAALVEVTDPAWGERVWRHPVGWGRFVTHRTGQPCQAVGYPAVVATTNQRDTHQAEGRINPLSLTKTQRHAVEVTNPPAAAADHSYWAGMSGAGVLSGGLLVGLVTEDPAGFDSRRLVVTPTEELLAIAEFRAELANLLGAVPRLAPVELAGLAHRPEPPRSPAELLRADAEITPFRDRAELELLLQWCRDVREPAASVRLAIGPGGQGKTRLARQLAERLTSDDSGGPRWATLLLADKPGTDDLEVLCDVRRPTLVVVDYAETRLDQVDVVLRAAARAEADVRVLLLARTAGEWRADLSAGRPHLRVLKDDAIVVPLAPLEPEPVGRVEAWIQAAHALSNALPTLRGYQHHVAAELVHELTCPAAAQLDDPRYGTVLAIQMDALAAVLEAADGQPTAGSISGSDRSPRANEEVLLDHEHRYWNDAAIAAGISISPKMQRALVAVATLWQAATFGDARPVAAAALNADLGDDTVTKAVDWLATVYRDHERLWGACCPMCSANT